MNNDYRRMLVIVINETRSYQLDAGGKGFIDLYHGIDAQVKLGLTQKQNTPLEIVRIIHQSTAKRRHFGNFNLL